MGKDKKQTVTQRLDPRSQGYVDQMRRTARTSADQILGQPGSFFIGPNQQPVSEIIGDFLNPYTERVIGGLNQEYDQARAAATRDANQRATAAGAFNSSRHGVTEGTRLGELDRAQMSQIGGLLSNQFNTAVGQGLAYNQYQNQLRQQQLQEPIFRAQVAQGLYGQGLGPVSQSTTQVQKGNLFKDLAGIGLTVGGALLGGPPGAAAGAAIGGGIGGGGGGGNALTGFGAAPAGYAGSIFDPNSSRLSYGY